MTAEVDIAVVGAGAVGLACAAQLAEAGHEVVVLERHAGPGRETTSRNSGVVHAGLYYEPGSLKARTCVAGRALLYARCARDNVDHRKTGKLIVATEASEVAALERLWARGRDNGVEGLTLIDDKAARALEPNVVAVAAIHSRESGVVDVHGLVESYAREATERGADLAYRVSLEAVDEAGGAWELSVRDADGDRFTLRAARVVNAAGLGADRVAARFGVDDAGWRLRYCKGDYFQLAPRLRGLCRGLVYPLPTHAGLGVHVTVDLAGGLRAGPDTTYVDAPRYDVDGTKAAQFGAALRRFLPSVRDEDLTADYAGVRPKLYGPGEPARDFVVAERPAGVVHLVGIESPGLTAAEAIAREVRDMLA